MKVSESWLVVTDDGNVEEHRFDIFLCKPPPGVNFFCGYVARLVDGGRLAQAQFFTDQNPPAFPEPAQEETFC